MSRVPKTADELRQIVSERLQKNAEVEEDGAVITVPRAQWHALDAQGCNWTMEIFGGDATGYGDLIATIVGQARNEFQLRT